MAMAEVIRFPGKFRALARIRTVNVNATRSKCLFALRMLFDDIREQRADPTKMYVCYGSYRSKSFPEFMTWAYLNIGFEPDELAGAVADTMEDYKNDPYRWDDDWPI
jgi:hypothetical protein